MEINQESALADAQAFFDAVNIVATGVDLHPADADSSSGWVTVNPHPQPMISSADFTVTERCQQLKSCRANHKKQKCPTQGRAFLFM